MGSVNKAILLGNVGSDPEIKDTSNGPIAKFRFATTERRGDREFTEWHTVTVLNDRLVPVVENYVRKGMQLYLEGRIATRSYEGQGGETKYVTEVQIPPFTGVLQMVGGGREADAEPERAREARGGRFRDAPVSDTRDARNSRQRAPLPRETAIQTSRGRQHVASRAHDPEYLDDEIPF